MTDHPSLVAAGDDFSIRYQSRHLYSTRDPRRRPQKIGRDAVIPSQTLVVLSSPLLGYGVREVLDRTPADSTVIALEVDPGLHRLCVDSGTQTPETLRTFVDPRVDELVGWLLTTGVHHFRRVQHISLNGGYAAHRDVYDNLIAILEETIRHHWQNIMTQVHMGPLWVRNLFENLSGVPGTSPVAALKTTLPVVVCGAGPSLDVVVGDLRAHRSGFFLLAVDTALRPLAERGLTPDALVVVEAQHANLGDFLGVDGRDTPLITDLTSHPQTSRHFSGRRYLFLSEFAPVRLLDRLTDQGINIDRVPPLGSVGVTAMELARRLTTGPVLLAGLDFAYAVGKSHAAGAPSMIRELLSAHRFRAPGNYALSLARPRVLGTSAEGSRINTDAVLVGYRDVLTRHADGRVYDYSPGGLDLGLEVVDNLGEFLAAAGATLPVARAAAPQISAETVARFLSLEADLRFRADAETYSYLTGERPMGSDLVDIWRDVEYCFIDFPDRERVFEQPGPDAAKRILTALRRFDARWRGRHPGSTPPRS